MRLRETVTVRTGGSMPEYSPHRARHARRAFVTATSQTRTNPEVLAVAVRLAGGDRGLLVLHYDGSITVANSRKQREQILRRQHHGS